MARGSGDAAVDAAVALQKAEATDARLGRHEDSCGENYQRLHRRVDQVHDRVDAVIAAVSDVREAQSNDERARIARQGLLDEQKEADERIRRRWRWIFAFIGLAFTLMQIAVAAWQFVSLISKGAGK